MSTAHTSYLPVFRGGGYKQYAVQSGEHNSCTSEAEMKVFQKQCYHDICKGTKLLMPMLFKHSPLETHDS